MLFRSIFRELRYFLYKYAFGICIKNTARRLAAALVRLFFNWAFIEAYLELNNHIYYLTYKRFHFYNNLFYEDNFYFSFNTY